MTEGGHDDPLGDDGIEGLRCLLVHGAYLPHIVDDSGGEFLVLEPPVGGVQERGRHECHVIVHPDGIQLLRQPGVLVEVPGQQCPQRRHLVFAYRHARHRLSIACSFQ